MISPTNTAKTQNNKHETLINAGKQIDQIILREQDHPDLANLLLGELLKTQKIKNKNVPQAYRSSREIIS